jgi:hypothetical protein
MDCNHKVWIDDIYSFCPYNHFSYKPCKETPSFRVGRNCSKPFFRLNIYFFFFHSAKIIIFLINPTKKIKNIIFLLFIIDSNNKFSYFILVYSYTWLFDLWIFGCYLKSFGKRKIQKVCSSKIYNLPLTTSVLNGREQSTSHTLNE